MLSTNEGRARAAEFAREWRDARHEAGEKQTFYIEFFEVFGVKSRRVTSFEEPVSRLREKRRFEMAALSCWRLPKRQMSSNA